MSGRRSWVLGGIVTAVALVAALVTWRLVDSGPYVARPPRDAPAAVDPAAAVRALQELETAVGDRDQDAAAELAPAADGAAADLLAAVVENAEELRVEEFTARYVDEAGAAGADGSWQAAVDLTWRFDGFDLEPAHEEVLVSFAAGDEGTVGITAFGGGDRRSPLWLSGPVEVRRSGGTLVLAATAEQADLLAERAAAAVPVVQRVLPQWQARLVVEVPASEEGLDAVLAAEPDTYDNIAAVTASVDGSLAAGAQVHVFVNPEVYDALDPIGGQVVISHEATHAATDAPLTSGVPLWLLEGFADYVALRDVDLPLKTTLAQILAQVQADGVPDQLPGQAEFGATDSHLGAAYEGAWAACVLLATRSGEDALVRLYEQVAAGQPLEEQLEASFGLTEDELVAEWQEQLQTYADAAADDA